MQKVALVTGGAKRIGKAICLNLAKKGYIVAIHYHQSSVEAKRTANQIRKEGGVCELFKTDLSDSKQIEELIRKVLKTFRRLDVLINNASNFIPSDLSNGFLEQFPVDFNINFTAPAILIVHFAKQGRKGNVINILDVQVVKNETKHMAYLLAKKSLHELTRLAAVELAPGIRVNAVAPGCILLPEGKGDAYLEKRLKNVPLQRKGKVKNIVLAVCFLLENDYVTGQTIFVDGGEHL